MGRQICQCERVVCKTNPWYWGGGGSIMSRVVLGTQVRVGRGSLCYRWF